MVRNTKTHILCTTFLLAAGGAGASTLPPVALLNSDATINFSAQDGLSVVGDLRAEYRTPTGGPVPYIFKTALTVGPLTLTPEATLVFNGFGIVPSFNVDLGGLIPAIQLAGQTTVYDLTYVSPDLPLGAIFNFDFGTPLLGNALTFGDVVQNQFETGEANVNVSGGAGPFGATFTYDGVLQPGNDTILADYTLEGTGPGVLGEIENFALGFLTGDDLLQTAFGLLQQADPCVSVLGLSDTPILPWLPSAAAGCRSALAAAPLELFSLQDVSVLNFSAEVSVSKSITPVPLPAAGLLLLGGLGAFGVAARRKRRKAA